MPQLHEADEQPGTPPAEPQDESYSPDDSAQPVELQSPEGELPLDGASSDAEQPDVAQPFQAATDDDMQQDVERSVEIASSEETPEDVAQLSQVAAADDTQPDVEQSIEIAAANEDTHEDVAQSVEIAPSEEPQPGPVALQPRQLSRRERETLDRQYRRFAACGRCGYFVADCRNYLGEAALVDALLDGEDGWLRLEGDETFRRLLTYAYGIDLDSGYGFFDGSCPECRRRFVYIARADHPTWLKIQI